MAYDVRQSRVARKKIASAETTVDIARYLERITYHGSCEPITDLAGLARGPSVGRAV